MEKIDFESQSSGKMYFTDHCKGMKDQQLISGNAMFITSIEQNKKCEN